MVRGYLGARAAVLKKSWWKKLRALQRATGTALLATILCSKHCACSGASAALSEVSSTSWKQLPRRHLCCLRLPSATQEPVLSLLCLRLQFLRGIPACLQRFLLRHNKGLVEDQFQVATAASAIRAPFGIYFPNPTPMLQLNKTLRFDILF